jgi:hypothetical protein
MKRIITILFLLQLSGCALWMASYDSNEYLLVTKIRTVAENTNCGNPINTASNIETMYIDASQFKNFAQYIPRNQATIDLSNNLYVLVDELHKKENLSPAYCKIKLNIISKSAEQIQQVVGSKPR